MAARKKNERLIPFFWDGRRLVLQVLADVSKNCSAFVFRGTKMKMKALRSFETPGRRKFARPNHFIKPNKQEQYFPYIDASVPAMVPPTFLFHGEN
jgi:hypothetical protein